MRVPAFLLAFGLFLHAASPALAAPDDARPPVRAPGPFGAAAGSSPDAAPSRTIVRPAPAPTLEAGAFGFLPDRPRPAARIARPAPAPRVVRVTSSVTTSTGSACAPQRRVTLSEPTCETTCAPRVTVIRRVVRPMVRRVVSVSRPVCRTACDPCGNLGWQWRSSWPCDSACGTSWCGDGWCGTRWCGPTSSGCGGFSPAWRSGWGCGPCWRPCTTFAPRVRIGIGWGWGWGGCW